MAKTIQAFVSTGSEESNQTHHFEQGSGDRGQPTRIKAVKGARYQLKDPVANEVGPEYIRSKRVGKNLHVSLYGSKEADLIIEGYYEEGFMAANSTGLYGMTESGQVYEYIPETPTTAGLAANLADGARPTSQVLGGTPIEGAFVLSALPFAAAAATGVSGAWIAAGAVTAAVVAAKSDTGLAIFNKDVVPSGQTGHLDSTTDTGVVGDNLTNINTPKISGKAAPNAAIEVVIHGVTYSTTSDAAGDYSITIPAANKLPDGKYIPLIKVTTAAGTSTADGTEFVVDTATDGTGQLVHTPANDTGYSSTDGITGNNKPAFSGTGEPGADVKIPIGGKVLTAVVDANGNWVTAPYADAIPDGRYPVTASITDKAGNTKDIDVGTVVIDTQVANNQPFNSADPNASATLTIGSIDDGVSSKDTGISSTDFITQDNTLTFQGVVGGYVANGDKVHLQLLGANNTVVIDQYLTPNSGVWRYDNQASVLPDGRYTIKANIVDAAGNVLKEQMQPLTIDTTLNKNFEGINLATPITDANASATVAITSIGADSGVKPDDFVTRDNTLSYSGTVSNFTPNGDVVQLQLKNVAGNIIANTFVTPATDGTWSWNDVDTPRADGDYILVATVVDKAGNRVNPQAQGQDDQSITIDTKTAQDQNNNADVNLGVTLAIGGIDDGLSATNVATGSKDTGISATDLNTQDGTLTFQGTTSGSFDASKGHKVHLEVILDGATTAAVDQYLDVTNNVWRYDNQNNAALPDGRYAIKASIVDLAGNVVAAATDKVLVIDSSINKDPGNGTADDSNAGSALQLGITTIHDPDHGSTDSGSSSTDFITNDQTLIIKGSAAGFSDTGPQAGDALRVQIIKPDGSVARTEWVTVDSSGNWALDNTNNTLDSGTYTVKADVVDLSGNIVKSATQALTVNTVVNVAPSNQGLTALITEEDTALAITGLSITDNANVGDSYTVTLVVTNGTLNVSGGSATIASNGTASVTLTGTKDAINATLAATVSYTPTANFNGSSELKMTTNDGSNGDAMSDEDSVTLTINALNDAPVVANEIADTDAAEAEAFTYVIPTNAFTDVDNNTLTYTAVVVDDNGVALTTQPSWFQFDPITRTVSGTPPSNSAGTVHVKVTASDGSLSQSDVFDIGVAPAGQNHAPVPTQTSLTNVLTTGLTTTVSITDNQTATNTAVNSTVTYTLKFSDAINTNTLAESDFSVMNGTLVANSLHQENATTWTVQAKTPSSGTNLMSLTLNNNSYKSLNTKDGLGDTSIHAYGAGSAVVDSTGSTAADTLLGSAADETFNIASGSTSAASGNDTVYAGGGDDKVFFNSFNVNGMDVDGGAGVNTLFVGGASESVTLDLTNSAVLARVQNFSSINITGRATPTTKNTLKLDWDAISRLSGTTDNPATYGVDESKLLVVSGDAGDEVQLTNFAAWSVGTLRNADTMRSELGNSYNFITDHTYKAYTLAGVTLFVDDNITTTSLASSTSVYRPRSYAMTVQDLFGSSFTDSDAGHTFKGVAITSAGSSAEIAARGEYQYSTDQGTSWVSLAAGLTDASAKFLAPTVLVRFLGIAGTPTVNPTDLKGRLVDSSGETNSANLSTGDTVNVNTNGGSSAFSKNSITISTLNRAPVVNDADGQLPYDAMGTTLTSGITNPASIDNMFRSVYTDPDLHSFQGVFITGKGNTSLGKYQYSTTGISSAAVWHDFGALSDSNAVYLEKTDYLRFVPAAGNTTNVIKPELTARLADRTVDFASQGYTAGISYDVSGANHGGSTPISADTITIVTPANTVGIAQASDGSTTVTTGHTLMSTTPTLSGSIGQLLKTGEVVEIWRDGTHVGDATISLGSSSWTYADSAVSAATHSYVAKYKASNSGAVLATSASFSLVVAATPLALDLNGDGVQTTSFSESMLFDLLATGTKQSVGWVSKQDGLLALDLNGDGQINSGAELFGSSTVLPNGAHAADGWVALKTLDSNGDGKLDAQDAQFNQLRVWVDANGNGQTDAKELGTLADHHIASIDLAANTHSVQQNGNVVQGFSTYTSTDGTTHEVADVGLQVHDASSNTLLTLGSGASIDLSQVLNDSHLKQIDMSSDSASNTVTLTLNDLLSMPASNGVHQLTLTGDANDSVHIDLAEWVNTGNAVSEGGRTYAVYSDVAMHSAQLLIDQAMLTAHHVS